MPLNIQKIELYDTTLRDGAGAEGISFSAADKLAILQILSELGIDMIEGGIPSSNPKDAEFFIKAAATGYGTRLTAFSSTKKYGSAPENDSSLSGLLDAKTETVCIFGKCGAEHARAVLNISGEENLSIIGDSVRFLKAHGKSVIFDAEHFFDAFRIDKKYALAALKAAAVQGAERLVLCDTNGGSFPEDIARATAAAVKAFPDKIIGIHCHDDTGLAVANSIAAVQAGARHVQGTLIGFGERCGNANLAVIAANLQLKLGFALNIKLTALTWSARRIAEIANIPLAGDMPYVGRAAFSHKAGMHSDGVLKSPFSFEHVPPETVGNDRRILLSEISGRAAVAEKLNALLPGIKKDSPVAAAVLAAVKTAENAGYQFEGAEASFLLLAASVAENRERVIRVVAADVDTDLNERMSRAKLVLEARGAAAAGSADGNGPVNALDTALRSALGGIVPEINSVSLTDYKVRVIDSGSATAAFVRVLITSSDGDDTWSTIGVSTDIIEASKIALLDSFEYFLLQTERKNKIK
ncbi:MAG: citramalate synthase [Clostridiaceae bacterium]|jgi:2-isopropylmalate synthase|nr:citramalate synthase [Clostridiaceae bacterium]